MAVIEIRDMEYTFDKDHDPVARVNPGDRIKFFTSDCFGNQITSEDQLIDSVDFSNVNPGSGPVYIEGANPGDVLKVTIEDIDVADSGIALTYDVGPLKDHSEIRTKVVDIEDGMALYNDIQIPIRPMIGVIGVAPAGEPIACGMMGDHGGNLDNQKITKGTSLYLPVNVDGALLQIGDLHALMGDGELSGAGLEIQGSATVTVDVIKDFSLNRPLLETESMWYAIGSGPDYMAALKKATRDLQTLMLEPYGWDETDVFIYMSLDGHVEICQACDLGAMDMVLRVGIPKIDGKELIK